MLIMRIFSKCSDGNHPPWWKGMVERKNGDRGSCIAFSKELAFEKCTLMVTEGGLVL